MKLYIAHVGFYDNQIGMYELHSNFLVVAENIQSAKQKIKEKEIFIDKNMHIDGIQEILSVDGYQVQVTKQEDSIENQIFDYDAVKNMR